MRYVNATTADQPQAPKPIKDSTSALECEYCYSNATAQHHHCDRPGDCYTGVMWIEDEEHLYLINRTAASLRLARRLAIQSRSGLDEEAYSH